MKNLDAVKVIVKALDDKKATDIKVIKIDTLTTLCDYFIIATQTSSTGVKSSAEEVEFKCKEAGITINSAEGYSSANWILLDFYDVVCHVFHKDTREFYNLENLWVDGEVIEIDSLLEESV